MRSSFVKYAIAIIGWFLAASPAMASFLDNDFYCRTYGCVVVHDGNTYDIYDNYSFARGRCCINFGDPMPTYYQRADTPNLTGTLSPHERAQSDEGMMIAVIEDDNVIQSVGNDSNGYLDAADTLNAFTLNSNTDLKLSGSGQQYSHSFFITSWNTRFSMRALAAITNASGDFANTIGLGDIKLTPSVTRRGNDGGFDFGRRANPGNIMIVNGVDDLGDLSGLPTQIMEFGRQAGIRQRAGDIDEQTIRLDMLYTMPDYDFSMGTGALDIAVEFDFYRER